MTKPNVTMHKDTPHPTVSMPNPATGGTLSLTLDGLKPIKWWFFEVGVAVRVRSYDSTKDMWDYEYVNVYRRWISPPGVKRSAMLRSFSAPKGLIREAAFALLVEQAFRAGVQVPGEEG